MKRRRILLSITLVLTCLASCTTHRDSFQIIGSSNGTRCDGKTMVLTIYNDNGMIAVDSTKIGESGNFHFSGAVSGPCVATLTVRHGTSFVRDIMQYFYIENSKIHVKIRPIDVYDMPFLTFDICGSKANDKLMAIYSDYISDCPWLTDYIAESTTKIIEDHLGDIYGPYLYYRTFYSSDTVSIRKEKLSKFLGPALDTYCYKLMKQQ